MNQKNKEMVRPRILALYLPQYHPFPENDQWWGKGFTEWTNVARAKKCFPGHNQPRIPADLGFYDLRIPEVREEQAQLAKEAGIEGFCYYDYWLGNGKRLMERPFTEVVESGKPDFKFCLAWANHSWYKKLWSSNTRGKDKLLIEQQYLGDEDYTAHFYALLPAFKDKRYVRVNEKLFYLIYDPIGFKDVAHFINLWRKLAHDNGLNDFYFVGGDYYSHHKKDLLDKGFDAIYNPDQLNIYRQHTWIKRAALAFMRRYLHLPLIYKYKDAMKYMLGDDCVERNVIPVIVPNWDHSPRSGSGSYILVDAKPKYFKQLCKKAIEMVKGKPAEEQLIILKSWNEWGEGNYMEPDLEYGHGYIDALSEAIKESQQ